jgi:hypothetical protein
MNSFGLPEFMILGAWVMAWMVFVLIVAGVRRHFRMKQLEMLHRERMAAIEKGLPPPEAPALSDDDLFHGWMARHRSNPRRPLANAVVFGALGAGFLVALILFGSDKWPFALIPLFVSVGCVLQYFILKPRE